MSARICRVCGGELFASLLLECKDMPAISQFLPTAEEFESDVCVDLKVCQCAACGLIQLDNDPVYYFREVIRSGGVSKNVREFRTRQFQDFVNAHNLKGKKILEIGCGRGEYLSIMSKTGADAYGLEFRPESVEECREKGLKVIQGFLETPDHRIEHGPFDAFYICNFLEHLDQPRVALRAMANNLVYGGIGLVEVPNMNPLLKEQTFYKLTLEHLLNFTEETLELALRINGFEVLSIGPILHGSPLSAVVRKRTPLDFSGFAARRQDLESSLREFLARFGPGEVAFWGAGHYTFGILSEFAFLKNIRYIIDSAPFKQDRFSPKSHLPIVPPAVLGEDPVKAVIVSAGGYSNEVAGILRAEFDPGIAVAVIRNNSLEIVP